MKLSLTATLLAWSFFFNCALGGAAMEDEPKPFLRGTTDNVVQGEDQEGNRILRNVLGTSETIFLIKRENQNLFLRGDGNSIDARGNTDSWERWGIQKKSNGYYLIRSYAFNKYLASVPGDNNSWTLTSNAEDYGTEWRFRTQNDKHGFVHIQNVKTNRYLYNTGSSSVTAGGNMLTEWQLCELVNIQNKQSGYYLGADEYVNSAGDRQKTKMAQHAADWEKLILIPMGTNTANGENPRYKIRLFNWYFSNMYLWSEQQSLVKYYSEWSDGKDIFELSFGGFSTDPYYFIKNQDGGYMGLNSNDDVRTFSRSLGLGYDRRWYIQGTV